MKKMEISVKVWESDDPYGIYIPHGTASGQSYSVMPLIHYTSNLLDHLIEAAVRNLEELTKETSEDES